MWSTRIFVICEDWTIDRSSAKCDQYLNQLTAYQLMWSIPKCVIKYKFSNFTFTYRKSLLNDAAFMKHYVPVVTKAAMAPKYTQCFRVRVIITLVMFQGLQRSIVTVYHQTGRKFACRPRGIKSYLVSTIWLK